MWCATLRLIKVGKVYKLTLANIVSVSFNVINTEVGTMSDQIRTDKESKSSEYSLAPQVAPFDLEGLDAGDTSFHQSLAPGPLSYLSEPHSGQSCDFQLSC